METMTNITPAQKASLTRDIKSMLVYITDMNNECRTQYPQPNGLQYLYGEPITVRRMNEAIIEYNNLVILRYDGDKRSIMLYSIERVTWLPQYKK